MKEIDYETSNEGLGGTTASLEHSGDEPEKRTKPCQQPPPAGGRKNDRPSDPDGREQEKKGLDWSEDLIGRQLLPFVGGLLLLGALAYWAPTAYRHLSPIVAFASELLASFAFLIGGRFFRRKAEYFGEVVSGIGAGALLTTLVAGSEFHHLYGASKMVALTLVSSLAIAIAGRQLASRTFEAIGVIGGFMSAWMPMHDHEIYLSAVLQIVILSLTLIMFLENRWRAGILVAGILGLAGISQFVFSSNAIWIARCAAYDLTALEVAAAYLICQSKENFDERRMFSPILLVWSLLMTLLVDHGNSYAWATLGFCGLILLIGTSLPKKFGSKLFLLYPAAFGAFILCPLSQTLVRPDELMVGIAAVLCGVHFGIKKLPLLFTSSVIAASALFVHLTTSRHGWSGFETGAALLAMCVVLAYRFHRTTNEGDASFTLAGLLGAVIVVGLPFELIPNSHQVQFWVSFALAAWAVILLLIGSKLELLAPRVMSYLILLCVLTKVMVSDLGDLDGSMKSALLTALGLAMLGSGYIAVRLNKHHVARK